MVLIRPAAARDLTQVVACQAVCWREAYTGLVDPGYLDRAEQSPRRTERWKRRLSGERCVYVALDGAEMVGVASSISEPDQELASLYVRRSHHGSGIGQSLLDAVLSPGPASLWVFENNARARAFYARNGFVPTGSRRPDPDTGIAEVELHRA